MLKLDHRRLLVPPTSAGLPVARTVGSAAGAGFRRLFGGPGGAEMSARKLSDTFKALTNSMISDAGRNQVAQCLLSMEGVERRLDRHNAQFQLMPEMTALALKVALQQGLVR